MEFPPKDLGTLELSHGASQVCPLARLARVSKSSSSQPRTGSILLAARGKTNLAEINGNHDAFFLILLSDFQV